MKKVITTVGTSLFTNYLEDSTNIKTDYDYVKDKRHREWEKCLQRADRIRQSVAEWLEEAGENASAEVKSLLKLRKAEKDHLEVYLLATDTVTSRLACEIIKAAFEKNVFNTGQDIKVYFNEMQDVITGLQMENYAEFVKTGAPQFVRRINKLVENDFNGTIFNISGGYKGLIPFMTIMAQVNNCDVVYIYEDSDTLIKIPRVPITVDYGFIEQFYEQIALLDQGIEKYGETKGKNYQVFEELEERGIVEILGDWAFLSPIGKIFLENYNSQFFVFYASDEVWKEINRQPDIQRILKVKLATPIRESKTEMKENHMVFDDGNNNNRIYYFEDNGKIYIYKSFENEEKARKYIQTEFDKEEIIRKSVLRKLKKQ